MAETCCLYIYSFHWSVLLGVGGGGLGGWGVGRWVGREVGGWVGR